MQNTLDHRSLRRDATGRCLSAATASAKSISTVNGVIQRAHRRTFALRFAHLLALLVHRLRLSKETGASPQSCRSDPRSVGRLQDCQLHCASTHPCGAVSPLANARGRQTGLSAAWRGGRAAGSTNRPLDARRRCAGLKARGLPPVCCSGAGSRRRAPGVYSEKTVEAAHQLVHLLQGGCPLRVARVARLGVLGTLAVFAITLLHRKVPRN
jgi:hypothetical protein